MNKDLTSSTSSQNNLWKYIGAANLIYCCIFAILGIISIGLLHTNNYCLYGEFYKYGETGEGSIHFDLGFFLPLIISFFQCSVSSVIACLCLSKNCNPKINTSTLIITAFLFLFCAISFLIYLI